MSLPSDPIDPVLADALFRPVRAGNAFEETMERMLQAIRLGVVPPGGRLPPERELSARLGVSRVTLREALRALQESGHIESRRGRYGGAFVQLPSSDPLPPPGDVEDTLTLRYALETGAAEVAASRSLTPQVRRHLRSCLADTATSGISDYRRTDSRLHLAIAEATATPSLTAAVADVRTRLNALLAAIPVIPANLTHSNEQHKAIIDAILDGDAVAARVGMAEHLAGTAALLRGFLA
ncbi:FadR/GntR family transcriptional regulator [Actinokineospora diospyrosa]|uniref:Transcriptional regulator, GntR family n=1 Tax=Actinokineospora diospyrosa TaxID=103728 RepID=A0ABT1IA89_9PSEU|nr:FCD domain-containing protein [Actinokineospora diospyrosa]MCP2269512.1 transcriptional regulator, GntR family [Actinokineospora diospyrosa]